MDHMGCCSEKTHKDNNFVKYYHTCRTHLSLNKDPPETQPIEPQKLGNVVAFTRVGDLHHESGRIAA